MKVLVDTNVLLDFLLEREPFKKDAEELLAAIAPNFIKQRSPKISILSPNKRSPQQTDIHQTQLIDV